MSLLKATLLFVLILSMQFLTHLAQAQEGSPELQSYLSKEKASRISIDSILPEMITYSVGYHFANFEYKEEKMKDTAFLQGVALQVLVPFSNSMQFSGEFETLGGKGTYDGQYQSGGALTSDTQNDIYTFRGVLGKRMLINENNAWIGYGGLAYRSLTNTQSGPGSYKREVRYTYLPLGAEWVSKLSNTWTAGMSGEYDLFLGGKVKSHLSEVDDRLPDIENTQSGGNGFRLTGNFARRIDSYSLMMKPYVQTWDIADSDKQPLGNTDYYIIEPKNKTLVLGADFAFIF